MRIVLRIVRLLLHEGPDVIRATVYMVPFRQAETHLVITNWTRVFVECQITQHSPRIQVRVYL